MIRVSKLKGQRVLARSTAQLVGSIGQLLVEPAIARVVAARVEGAVGPATVLPWDSVSAIGPDAVIIESAEQLTEPEAQRQGFVTDLYALSGRPLLTEEGDSIGRLEDVEVDEASGRVVSLVVDGRSVPLERFVALGPDAVIVPAPS
jgi:sporulation protein YlmC with PRC-barrel domain